MGGVIIVRFNVAWKVVEQRAHGGCAKLRRIDSELANVPVEGTTGGGEQAVRESRSRSDSHMKNHTGSDVQELFARCTNFDFKGNDEIMQHKQKQPRDENGEVSVTL